MRVRRWINVSFQCALAWTLVATLGFMFGAEPETVWEFRIQHVAMSAGVCACTALWIAGSELKRGIKIGIVAAIILTALIVEISCEGKFRLGDHLIEPAQRRGSRLVHQALGLSYGLLPNCRLNVQPMMTKQSKNRLDHISALPQRLRFGDMTIISRMVIDRRSRDSNIPATSIILEIQRAEVSDLNGLYQEVLRMESQYASYPNMCMIRHTHCSKFAGIDAVEFEFVEEPIHLISRQVFLRKGGIVFNFMLNTGLETDRVLFDAFLNSIKLETGTLP